MTEYTVTATAVPAAASTASAELDRAIIDASRELIAAQRARPRDPARIEAAREEYDALIALRDAGL